ncbi:MAG: glycosyltransferase family 9 protein [Planctomycetes bacterium]|nr:glycosyltransferase family 9 protein [Planctomycetota bacterium]
MSDQPLTGVSFDRILIIRLSALGDVIQALHAFHNLRTRFPQARIAWAVEDRVASVLKDYPGLDELIVFPRKRLKRAILRPWLWPSAIADLVRHARRLRAFGATVSFDFQGTLKSGLHAWAAAAPARLGFARSKERAHKFANFLAQTPEKEHRVERSLSLLRAAGIPVAPARPAFPVPPADRAAIEAWIREKNARPYVVCHVGTSSFGAIKKWPRENWSRLADLIAASGHAVIFAWGPGERDAAEAAARATTSGRAFAGPDTSTLSTLVSLIRGASAFVGCDSGPLHLAAAAGAPVVALFGPKDPAVYGPYCDNHVVVWKGLVCSPCTLRHCPIPDCMNFIEPAEVARATAELIDRVRPRPSGDTRKYVGPLPAPESGGLAASS